MKNQDSIKELAENIVFGGTAGVIGQLTIYPLYTAKTDLHNNPDLSRSLLNRLRAIQQIKGFRGLYSGIIPTLSLTFPEKAIKLAMNDHFRSKLSDKDGNISVPRTMIAGAGAGLCQVIMTNPMELLRITMQTRQAHNLPRMSMTNLAIKLGARRLYRDVPATLMRDIPFSTIFFTLHSGLMHSMSDGTGDTSSGRVLVSGFLASTVASAFVTPMDCIKTRLMSETGMQIIQTKKEIKNLDGESTGRVMTKQNSSFQRIKHSFRSVYSEFGIRGLFRGVDARIMINAPLFGIATMFYELQKKLKQQGYI